MANKKAEKKNRNSTNTQNKKTQTKKIEVNSTKTNNQKEIKNKKQNVRKEIKENKIDIEKNTDIKIDSKKKEESKVANKKINGKNTIIEKKNTNGSAVSSDEMSKLIKIIVVLVIIVVVFYLITVLITKNRKKQTNNYTSDTTPAVIQYDNIIIGTIFNQVPTEYYVLIKDKENGPYETLLSSYVKTYQSKKDSLKIYNSYMNDVFNKKYIAETSNLNVSSATEFRVSDITLIKISNHSVTESYEGIDNVQMALKNMTK